MKTFKSLKAKHLLAVLTREPLRYRIARQRGSHRRLVSDAGYPPLSFSFHDRVTLPPRVVKKILIEDVGLGETQALELL